MSSEIVVTDEELPSNVLEAIAAGRKIEAIKLLREATGLGLANAKVLVDRAAARHAQQNGTLAPPRQESNSGRLLGALALIGLAVLAYRYFVGG